LRFNNLYTLGYDFSDSAKGNFNKFEEIETNLSEQLGFSKSIVMGNGFLVNATVIPAITRNTIGKKNKFFIFIMNLIYEPIAFYLYRMHLKRKNKEN